MTSNSIPSAILQEAQVFCIHFPILLETVARRYRVRRSQKQSNQPQVAPPTCNRYPESMKRFERITIDPELMGGKPCIHGMRVTVGMIVEALGAGRTIADLLNDFPYIEEKDILEALGFAAQLAQGHEVLLAS